MAAAAAILSAHRLELQTYLNDWATRLEGALDCASHSLAGPWGLALSSSGLPPESPLATICEEVEPKAISLEVVEVHLQAAPQVKILESPRPLSAISQLNMDSADAVGLAREMEHELRGAFGSAHPNLPKHRCLQIMHLLEGSWLSQTFCSFVIVLNAVYIAYTTEQQAQNPVSPTPDWHSAVDYSFTAFYTVELCIRIVVKRLDFFIGRDVAWNLFDVCIVVSTFQEHASMSGGFGNVTYLRITRMTKVLKVFRAVRLMRQFRELRLVLDSMLGCIRSMAWTAVLVFVLCYIFGVCFVQAATHVNASHLQKMERDGGEAQEDLQEPSILVYWGSLPRAMASLFICSTSGADWHEYADSLKEAGHHYYGFFCLYIAFFFFVIMNSVTSVFVESVHNYSSKDQAMVIQNQLDNKQEHMAKLVALFAIMDMDGSGEVSQEEFTKHLNDPRIHAFANCLEIDASDLDAFFSIISRQGRQDVDLETFVEGCIKLRGMARAMDMVEVMNSTRKIEDRVNAVILALTESNGCLETPVQLVRRFGKPGTLSGRLPSESSLVKVRDGKTSL